MAPLAVDQEAAFDPEAALDAVAPVDDLGAPFVPKIPAVEYSEVDLGCALAVAVLVASSAHKTTEVVLC